MMKLRALEPEDLDVLYRIENDTTLWRYGTATAPYSRYQLRQYLQTASNDAFRDGQIRWAIADDSGQTIGFVDLQDIQPLHARAEVGIVVLPEFQRQGVATMALEQMSQYAKQHLHLHQLYAYVPADNLPSLHLFTRAGYTKTATLQEWLSTPDGWSDVYIFSSRL